MSEHKNTAFIWLCPGKGDLEEQSRNRMMEFIPTRQTYDLFEALSSGFSRGSTTFINWEKVTKKGNRAITDGERKNLFERILEAHKDGVEFILIIDEEHSNNTSKAKDIIDYFNAKHIVRVSATTISNRDVEYKEIEEQDVIDEGLITSAISVNEGVEEGSVEDDALLLKLADIKRKEIYNAYKEKGVDIRPLVLIQFPNGQPEKIESVESALRDMGYTRENKMVAAWLSGDKEDIPEDLTENTSDLAFLFIKQAINTGWDCPRAKILVKLREGSDEAFQIQTIGRIRRMPEQKHYEENLLDFCYVYTFDKEFRTGLLAGLDKAYIPKRLFLKKAPRELELIKELKDEDGNETDMRTVYNLIRDTYIKKYNLTGDKKLNRQKMSLKYKFEDCILGEVFQGVVVLSDSLEEGSSNITTRTPVNTHNHGMALRHTFDEFKNVLGVQVETVRQIFDRLFSFKHDNRDKLLNLGLKEYYAFIINNAKVIKDDLRDLSADVYRQNRLDLIEKYKSEDIRCDDGNTVADLEVERARWKKRIGGYQDMRADGEMSAEDYKVKVYEAEKRIEDIDALITKQTMEDAKKEKASYDLSAIRERLETLIDLNGYKVSEEVIDMFVERIIYRGVVNGCDEFVWVMNLSGTPTDASAKYRINHYDPEYARSLKDDRNFNIITQMVIPKQECLKYVKDELHRSYKEKYWNDIVLKVAIA